MTSPDEFEPCLPGASCSAPYIRQEALNVPAAPKPPWHDMADEPPQGTDLDLDLGPEIVPGWMTKRFLNGKPTFWAWLEGKCELVFPRRWRVKA